MRILSWNVNGWKKLRGYQPFSQMKTWSEIVSHLGADIVCLQETKLTRKQALEDKEMCLPGAPWKDSFWDFHPSRGYSGTAVYTRNELLPIHFERGLTGSKGRDGIGCYAGDYNDLGIDDEGRSCVLDFGLFVLFNLYCPVMGSEERHDFRLAFYDAVNERARNLVAAGRNVIIVGDINIARQPIDHCDFVDKDDYVGEGSPEFYAHRPRAWLNRFIAPNGPFHDVQREAFPERRGMYTCWSTLKNARPTNYGTRIDYTLVSSGLIDWVKAADIAPEVPGSDHCPVWVDLWDERDINGERVRLKDLMASPTTAPASAASKWDEFRVKGLKTFFDKAALAGPTPTSSLSASASGSSTPSSSLASQAPLASSSSSASTQLSNGKQQSPSAAPPSPLKRSASNKGAAATSPKAAKASKGSSSAKQPKLASFFGAANVKKRSPPLKDEQAGAASSSSSSSKRSKGADEVGETTTDADAAAAAASAAAAGGEDGDDNIDDDDVDWDALAALPDPGAPTTTTSTATTSAAQTAAWSGLFSAPPPPKCPAHDEDAKSWTVNKPGPNHGRRFYLCSRMIGPGYEKGYGSTKGGGEGGEYRCGFFMWHSEWMKRRKKRG